MKRVLLRRHVNIIAIAIIGVLISGQDIYIFTQIGPTFDLLKGPEGIKDAQVFSNMRNMIATMITHSLLIGVIFLLLSQPRYNVTISPNKEEQ